MLKWGIIKCLLGWVCVVRFNSLNAVGSQVWLDGPSIADCRDTIRLVCHYCDIPLANWTWSRTYGSSAWNLLFRDGSQAGPSPVSLQEEINGTVSLIFSGGRDVEGDWKCGIGNLESQTLSIRKECKPTSVRISIVDRGTKQIMLTLGSVFPIPSHVKLTITSSPSGAATEAPVTRTGCSGMSWAPDCTYVSNIPGGLAPGFYSYVLEVTTLTKTVLRGSFTSTDIVG